MFQEEEKKTLLITVFHGFVSKNILNTDAFIRLRDSGEFRIVLVVPEVKVSFFKAQYQDAHVHIEGVSIDAFAEGKIESLMHNIARLLINTHYLHYKRLELLESDKGWGRMIRHLLRETFVRLFAGRYLVQEVFRWIDSLTRRRVYEDIFDTYKPSLVFSTDIFDQSDAQFIYEAKRRGIKTLGMVRSWDNCLSKGLLRVKPDEVITNNTVLAEEVATIHGVASDIIHIVGLPQFDSFFKEKPIARETFFKQHGLDPKKRLVMFAPGGNVLSNTDPDILRILIDARDRGELPADVQFFVRNHPHHPADFGLYKDVQGLAIQTPGEVLDTRTHKNTELTRDDLVFLRNILAHTDILLWVATSLCLDALVYDVPQVVINFDGDKERDYYHSVRRYHDEGHMVKMFSLKPFRVANSKSDLIQYIGEYLANPLKDSVEREAARKQQLFLTDGKAGERIAQIITNTLS